VPEKISAMVRSSFGDVELLYDFVALRSAYGHKLVLIASGHRRIARIRDDLVRSCRSRILFRRFHSGDGRPHQRMIRIGSFAPSVAATYFQ
jgi:hypothetical protein